jgi:hypothetical protein
MKGQKEAVVELVRTYLPNFNLYKDIALVMLTRDQLEALKNEVACGILDGRIEYGKDRTKMDETRAYARSMVMNHLKKAKALNGNQIYGVGSAVVQPRQPRALTAALNKDILSEDLKAFVATLVE